LCDKNENGEISRQIDAISFKEAGYTSRLCVAANNGNVIAAARLKGTLKQPPRFNALAGVQIAASNEALRNAVRSDPRLFDEITRITRSGVDYSWFTVEEI